MATADKETIRGLLEGTFDERVGCPRLRPVSLDDCSGFVPR